MPTIVVNQCMSCGMTSKHLEMIQRETGTFVECNKCITLERQNYWKNYLSNIENGKDLYTLDIVEKMYHYDIINWNIYHAFITEERNYGEIYGYIHNGKFQFRDIKFSDFKEAKNDTETAYLTIYKCINHLLKVWCK